MKYALSLFMMLVMLGNAWAAIVPSGRGRATMAGQMMTSPRATVSRNDIAAMAAVNNPTASGNNSALAVTPEVMLPAEKDIYQQEKEACIRNNIGVTDTFVWASRNSNLNSYSSMVEDVNNPANNACFVKVGLKSLDNKIVLNDIQPKYFEMGHNITCGSWVDEEMVKQKILDAKKSARVWGTIGASVGGAAVGVGAMELFGNELIGGAVEGQKSLSSHALVRSQVLALKDKDVVQYNSYITDLTKFKAECDKIKDSTSDNFARAMCREYEPLFDLVTK